MVYDLSQGYIYFRTKKNSVIWLIIVIILGLIQNYIIDEINISMNPIVRCGNFMVRKP